MADLTQAGGDTREPQLNPPELVDGFGRVVNDLRISVTDRCNFRCVYCMPAEGMDWLPGADLLTFAEIVRLAGIFVGLGTRTVRLTGGEPLMRKGLVDLVAGLRALDATLEIAMTTNGILLERHATALAAAGLNRVNISLDSLNAERFLQMSRRQGLDTVLKAIDAAQAAGLTPVKVNVVVMRGLNDVEVVDFARFARERDVRVRFIEYMPLDAEQAWERDRVVPGAEIRATIAREIPLRATESAAEPATRFTFGDRQAGEIGFIDSVTDPFCERCNRVRITADGNLRTCLFASDEHDLRTALRSDATDATIIDLIRTAVRGKQAGHRINHSDFVRPARSMSQIGG